MNQDDATPIVWAPPESLATFQARLVADLRAEVDRLKAQLKAERAAFDRFVDDFGEVHGD